MCPQRSVPIYDNKRLTHRREGTKLPIPPCLEDPRFLTYAHRPVLVCLSCKHQASRTRMRVQLPAACVLCHHPASTPAAPVQGGERLW